MRSSLKCRIRTGRIQTTSSETTHGPASFHRTGIVFDVLTNRYRLVTAVDFEKGIVWIKWIGTHKEYDKIDIKRVKHGRR